MGNVPCGRCKCKPCQQCLGSPDVDQIVMFGQEAAGKTTLLYRLKVPNWQASDMVKVIGGLKHSSHAKDDSGGHAEDMAQMARPLDPGYHYEHIYDTGLGYHYGIWDVPGNDAMVRMWPLFYRYIRVTAVLYVIDASEKGAQDSTMLANARRQIRFLLNEDELRPAAFCLICNIRTNDELDAKPAHEFVEQVLKEVGVPEIKEQGQNKARFRCFTLNIATQGQIFSLEWTKILRDIYRIKSSMSQ